MYARFEKQPRQIFRDFRRHPAVDESARTELEYPEFGELLAEEHRAGRVVPSPAVCGSGEKLEHKR